MFCLTCGVDLPRCARPLLQPHPRSNAATLLRRNRCCHRLLRSHLLLLLCGVLCLHLGGSAWMHATALTAHRPPSRCSTATHSLLSHAWLLLLLLLLLRSSSRCRRRSGLLLLLLLCSRLRCCCLLLLLPLELCLACHLCLLLLGRLLLLCDLQRAEDAAARLPQSHLRELEVRGMRLRKLHVLPAHIVAVLRSQQQGTDAEARHTATTHQW
jgi:hypothetical protein